jgi:hypothetical protein
VVKNYTKLPQPPGYFQSTRWCVGAAGAQVKANLLIDKNNCGAPGEIARRSALRASSSASLRTAAALRAAASKSACGRLVELGLFSAGSSNFGQRTAGNDEGFLGAD